MNKVIKLVNIFQIMKRLIDAFKKLKYILLLLIIYYISKKLIMHLYSIINQK